MPSWIPGSYLLREYAQHVISSEAFDERANVLDVEKIAHNIWRVHALENPVTLRLKVYALDESVRGAWLDTERAWFNGPCLFARPHGYVEGQVRLIVERPVDEFVDSKVATALSAVAVDSGGFGEYVAADYEELLDCPVVIGHLDCVDFEVGGVPHSLAVLGRHDGDLEPVARDVRRICAAQIEFFGAPAPFERYSFLCLAVDDGYGGLEHCNSSMLMFPRSALVRAGDTGVLPAAYQRFLSLVSHEYFHAWHVKRSKPAAFIPYRPAERNLTRLLWVFEGITSYYQDRFVLRSGLIDVPTYLKRLGELIAAVMRVPGRHLQSLADSSFDAWDKLYKPNANSPNAGVSYYTRGALAALALDLQLRLHSGSAITLDTLVQSLWKEYGATGIGLGEDGFEELAIRLAGDHLSAFFGKFIHGTEDPPLTALFGELGIRLEPVTPRAGKWLGIVARPAAAGIECATVLDGGPAQAAGLNPGDIIVALRHEKLMTGNLEALLSRFEVGERVAIHYFRGAQLRASELRVGAAPPDAWKLSVDKDAPREQLALRNAWLHAEAEPG